MDEPAAKRQAVESAIAAMFAMAGMDQYGSDGNAMLREQIEIDAERMRSEAGELEAHADGDSPVAFSLSPMLPGSHAAGASVFDTPVEGATQAHHLAENPAEQLSTALNFGDRSDAFELASPNLAIVQQCADDAGFLQNYVASASVNDSTAVVK